MFQYDNQTVGAADGHLPIYVYSGREMSVPTTKWQCQKKLSRQIPFLKEEECVLL